MSPSYSSGYVRVPGDGQAWHAATTRASVTACGLRPPFGAADWPQFTVAAPAILHMCPECRELDPRRTTQRRAAAR
jgi:hypothetical protein